MIGRSVGLLWVYCTVSALQYLQEKKKIFLKYEDEIARFSETPAGTGSLSHTALGGWLGDGWESKPPSPPILYISIPQTNIGGFQ